MTRALSVDLRQRVVAAIDDGLSCRRAAERFGISAASAIRWRSRLKEAGDVVPKRPGGDRRSQRIEAHSQLILDAVTVKADITLAELQELLKRRGISAGIASLWRFFQRRKITLKKRQRTPPSNGAAIEMPRVRSGSKGKSILTLSASSLSTKPAPIPKWRDFTDVRRAASDVVLLSLTDIGRPRHSPLDCVPAA